MKTARESGFSDVLIAILAFLAIASLVAWLVLSNQTSQQPAPSPTTNQTKPPDQAAKDPNEGYVVIREWGVRFKTDPGISPIMYHLDIQTEMPNANATFSTEALAQYGDSCAGKVSGRTPLGMLVRTHASQADGTPSRDEFTKQIGDYTYHYITPQAACADDNGATDALQTETLAAFKPLIATLEAVTTIVIKEWHVMFTITPALGGITYVESKTAKDQIEFTVKELANREPNCAQTGFASLRRSITPVEPHELLAGNIDGYYYYFRGSDAACSQNSTNYSYESELRNNLKQAIQSLRGTE